MGQNHDGLKMSILGNSSVGTRLASLSSLLVFFIFAIVIVTVYFMASGVVHKQGEQSLHNQAALVRDMVATFDRTARSGADMSAGLFAGMFKGSFELKGSSDVPVLSIAGKTLNNDYAYVDEFTKESHGSVATVFARKGDDLLRISTSLKKEDGNRAVGTVLDRSHPGYRAIMDGKEYLGKARLFGKDYMTKYLPLKNPRGSIIGCLFIGFDISKDLKALSETIRAIKIGETGYVYAFDGEGKEAGTMIIHPSLEGKNMLDVKSAEGKEIFKEMIAKKDGIIEYDWKNAGDSSSHSVINVFTYNPGLDLVIVVSAQQSELNKPVTIMATVSAIGGVAGVAVLCVLMFIMIRTILKPLVNLVDTAHKVAAGDLTVNLEHKGNDEIAKVTDAIKGMVDKLKGVIGEIKQASSSVASGSDQLSSTSEEITRTMGDQSTRSSQIATATEEMSQTVIDIAKNASNIAHQSSETAIIAKKGAEVVDKSVIESRTIVETVRTSAGVMQTLGEKSKQIGEIVDVINDIADQTNLLALNAAIEAARAGEQGRGFAVVADEVRKLAERTAQATAEISRMIGAIQGEVSSAVEAMNRTNEKVNVGLEYSVEAGEQLKAIVQSVTSLQSLVQQIATATEEMSTTSEAISGDIQAVAGGAREISGESDQIAKSSAELARLAGQLKTTVNQFRV
jgi:methyl-accepting chemotaxis protein